MSEDPPIKHSGFAVTAFLAAAILWIYCAAVILFGNYLGSLLNGMECTREDFGACALQNLFTTGFAAILVLIIFVIIPLVLIAVSTISGVVGCFQKTRKRVLAVVGLCINALFLIVFAGWILL